MRLAWIVALVGVAACTLKPVAAEPEIAGQDIASDDTGQASDATSPDADATDTPDLIALDDSAADIQAVGCDPACPAWKQCQGVDCVPKACTGDGECNAALLPAGVEKHFCYHKTCQAFQCSKDADCTAGQKCNTLTYLCYAPATGCTWDGMCADADPCSNDGCDLATGKCTHTPAPGCCKTAANCDDKLACTDDTCQGGTCQHVGKAGCCANAGDCDDGNPCSTDTCAGGKCTFGATAGCCQGDGACDDDDPASFDKCWQNACLHQWQGLAVTCGGKDADCKGNSCLAGSCKTGKCAYTKVGACCSGDAACLKNVACLVDSCSAGVCSSKQAVGTGTHLWAHFDTAAIDGWIVEKLSVQAWFHGSNLGSVAGGGALRFGVPGVISYDTSTVAKGTATSVAFAVPKSLPKLKFWVYLDVEPGTAVDTCGVDVVVAGKATTVWSKAKDMGGSTTAQAWKLQNVDLAGFAGQTVQLRAWFDQKVHDAASKQKLGFLVDELEVTGGCP